MLDANLPDDSRQLVEYSMKNVRDADALDSMAQQFAQQGYPLTAYALSKRAQTLRGGFSPAPPPALPPQPQPAPQPAPGSQTAANQGGSSDGVLPLLALFGAFHLLA